MGVHTLPRGPAKVLLVMYGVMLFALAMADIAYGAYSISWAEELRVRNETDRAVTLAIGETHGRLDVPPDQKRRKVAHQSGFVGRADLRRCQDDLRRGLRLGS